MHSSSRMRTSRLLPISSSIHCSGGVYLPGGIPARGCTCRGGYTCQGVYLPGGVPTRGCTCRGVCFPAGGVPAGGLPARGCICQGDVPARGCTCLPGGTYPGTTRPPPCEQNDWQTSFACGKKDDCQRRSHRFHVSCLLPPSHSPRPLNPLVSY